MSLAPENPVNSAPQNRPAAPVRRRLFVALVAALVVLAGAAAVDGLFVEPYRIEVTHYTVSGRVAAPLKIAHLSDLHTHGLGQRERRMLEVLAAEKPDIIVITGDSLGNRSADYEMCRDVYMQLHAPLGVWFVRGNWENERPLRHERAFYQEAGVHLLLNASQQVQPGVWLVGLDDPYSGTARPDAALAGVPSSAYKIALFHSPAFFDRIAGRVNLCLTGHTHGGQVRLPYVRPLWLPKGCGRFVEGWYQERGTKMYVNRGLGMSMLPVRFHCRPEITFITIVPEPKAS
ncbi:MAG TPA: metallophosphoesterase [Candidatus Acidoferrales bacterium]|nr:metallophosphoesterase [Candidatus Acidoferrales bacterium]